MSRHRYISTDISIDTQVAALAEHGMLALVLYTWAIPHADDWGRMNGDPRQFKLQVCPGLDVTIRDVDDALTAIAEAGLWHRYEVKGKQYIAFPPRTWFKHQNYIARQKRTMDGSAIPAPTNPDYSLPECDDSNELPQIPANPHESPQNPTSVSLSVSVSPSVSLSPSERDILPPDSPTKGKRDVVTDASASSRDDFFSEDDGDDLSFLDAPEDKHDAPARAQAQPANITPHPTLTARAATPATASKDKPTPKARTTWADDSEPMRLACYLKTKILAANPDARAPKDLTAWASDIDKALRLDKRTPDGLRAVIDFATTDSFWQTNILSAGKLRIQYAQLAGQMRNRRQQGENYHNGHTATGRHYAATGTDDATATYRGPEGANGQRPATLPGAQGTRGRTTGGLHQPDPTKHGVYAAFVD